MKRTITIKEVQNMNISTWSKKDDSPRGCKTVSTADLKVGDKIVIDNYFTEIIDNPIYTEETFDCSTAVPGDLVTEEVVDFFINCLPPACMRSDCSQLGEAYSHKEDPASGKWRATFLTFKLSHDDIWEYCGHCFAGENVER